VGGTWGGSGVPRNDELLRVEQHRRNGGNRSENKIPTNGKGSREGGQDNSKMTRDRIREEDDGGGEGGGRGEKGKGGGKGGGGKRKRGGKKKALSLMSRRWKRSAGTGD